ncbi:MAG: AI-2E family transporter [Phycisphaerales bacterium JB039]
MAEKPDDTAGAPESERPSWLDRHLWQIQPIRDILAIFVVIGLFWLGSELSIVTVPLLLAILLAYLLEPVIVWVMRRTSLKRRGAVTAILTAFVALVIVPAALGLTYGAIQGIGLVSTGSKNIRLLYSSVDAELEYEELRQHWADQQQETDPEEQPADTQQADPPQGDGGDALPGSQGVDDGAAPDGSAGADQAQPAASEGAGDASQGATETGDAPISRPVSFEQVDTARDRRDRALQELREEAGESWVDIHNFITSTGQRTDLVDFLAGISNWAQQQPGTFAMTAAGVSLNAAQALFRISVRTFGIAFGAFLTAFFFYFVATEWIQVKHFWHRLIPERNKDLILDLAAKFDRAISAFIRGRLTIAFIQAIVFSIGYFIIGVPAAFILGPAVALLSIVPYLALIGLPISVTLLWLENHTGLRGNILWVLGAPTALYFLGQALDDYVLTPAIQGKSQDMSTPTILFASLAGGALFGVFGLLIAIPIAACLKIVIQEILWPRFRDWAEGRSKDFLPIKSE